MLGRVLGLPNGGNTREQAAEATAASRQRRGGRRKRDLAAAQAGRGRKSPCHISSQDRVRVCLAHRGAVLPYANPGLSRARGQPPQRQPLPQSLQHEEDPVPNPRGRGRPRSASVTARRCHQPYPRHRTPARGPSPAPRTATNGVQGEKGPPRPTSRPAEDSTSPGGARGRAGGHRKEGSVQKGEAGRGWGAPAETTLRARCRSGSFSPRTPAAGSWWGRAQPTAPGQPRVLLSCVVSLCPAWCPCVLRLPGVPASPPHSARAQPSPAAEAGGRLAGRRAPRLDARPWPFLARSTDPCRASRARAAPAAPPQQRGSEGRRTAPSREPAARPPSYRSRPQPQGWETGQAVSSSAIESFKYAH